MTLKTLLYNIAQYAIGNKIINYSAAGPSLYGLNMETIKDYPVLFASPTGNHNITPNLTTYTITLYYIDRLTRGGDNDIDILSTSVEGLKSIVNGIKYLPGVIEVYDDYNITNFADTQKMSDNVAGAYATITIRTANNSTCPDGGIISNGSFIPSDNIVVKNQNKNLIVNENGNYTLKPDNGYTGLGRVIVKVDVPDDNGSYEEGYEEGNKVGIEAGKRIQKELMQPITITSNGTYIREDGYSEVVVDVDGDESRYEEGYQDGYNQGEEDQKAKLTNITIRENGTYTSEDGYGEVIVNVEGGSGGDCEEAYENGYLEGQENIKNRLGQITITENGIYDSITREYFNITDDKFELFEGGGTDGCCRFTFKVLGSGFMISTEGNYSIIMASTLSKIRIHWGGSMNDIPILENEWNTIEICGNVVNVNGENYSLITGQTSNVKNILYLGKRTTNPTSFLFNEFSYWNTKEAFLSNETPDYIVRPSNNNDVAITTKDGETYYSPNLTEDAYANIEIDEPQQPGWNKIVVNVEGYEEGYEQGKIDQKALMTTATFTRNGTYIREDGYNEVVVNVPSTLYPKFFGVLSDTIGINYHNIYDYMGSDGEIWAGRLWAYVELNPDKTSNGMMYEFDDYSDIDRAPIANIYMGAGSNLDVLNLSSTIDYNFNSWGLPVWGKKSLVTPWVYNVNNSPTTTKILPDCILGGFECDEVEYINRVFEGAEKLRVFQWLHNLGKSFTSVNTLDLSVLTRLNYDIYGLDSFIEIANSVYDFAVDGMNVNGISYSNVKLPTSVSQEAIDAWIAKGWRVLQ